MDPPALLPGAAGSEAWQIKAAHPSMAGQK